MPSHLSKKPEARSRRRPIVVLAVVVVVAVVGVVAWAVLSGPSGSVATDDPSPSGEATEPESAEPSGQDAPTVAANGSLPFSLDGVPADAAVQELPEGADPIALANEWTFGGDYVTIGSAPIDAQTVFGSSTSTPEDSSSYVAALISSDGTTTPLEEPSSGEKVWEPQDGTGDASRVVWRSSALSYSPFSGSDDWRLQVWSAEDGTAVTLGSAADLNDTDETPTLGAEVVPTTNGEQVLFASMRADGDAWSPSVLAYGLASPGADPVVVGEGCYPAAIEGGAVYAGDVVTSEEGAVFYHGLYRWDGSESSRVFSVSSEGDSWGISGVWASGSWRVVSFSSTDASAGSYIGVWSDDFSACVAWVHTPAPGVVASMNGEWLVWGSGSQSENAGMYALRLATGEISYLGAATGYSRPSIASENNAVLVPICDGENAASFRVGTLE